jgi:hypothetical protein
VSCGGGWRKAKPSLLSTTPSGGPSPFTVDMRRRRRRRDE